MATKTQDSEQIPASIPSTAVRRCYKMAHKVISNYTNHVAKTPVDAVFKKFAWEKPAATEAT